MRTKKFLSLLLSAAMAFSLLTATAFAAVPAEEENGFFDFLLGKKYTYLYAALTLDQGLTNKPHHHDKVRLTLSSAYSLDNLRAV